MSSTTGTGYRKVAVPHKPIDVKMGMRRFTLVRDEDVSGVSGVGVVAQGCVFGTGKAVLAWVTEYRSVAFYDSIEELEAIHGHNGRTHIEWIDQE